MQVELSERSNFVRFNSVDDYYVVISSSYRVASWLLTTKINQSMLHFPKVPYLRAFLGSKMRLIQVLDAKFASYCIQMHIGFFTDVNCRLVIPN